LARHEVESALFEAATKWIGDECHESEIRKTIDSGVSAGKHKPRSTPPRDDRREFEERHAHGKYKEAAAAAPTGTAPPSGRAQDQAADAGEPPARPVRQKAQGYVLTPGAHTTDNGDYV